MAAFPKPDINAWWDARKVEPSSFDKNMVSRVVSIRQSIHSVVMPN
jgi:hypothetical protein